MKGGGAKKVIGERNGGRRVEGWEGEREREGIAKNKYFWGEMLCGETLIVYKCLKHILCMWKKLN